jgi:hypothetical protein
MTTKSDAPKLARLAKGCHDGACNIYALIREFGEAITELPVHDVQHHCAVQYIIGHISFLLGESIGPSSECYENYIAWANQ